MQFDIYCDESRPDLFSSCKSDDKHLVIGSLWLEKANRNKFKSEIHELRNKHKIGGEFKWNKVSPSRYNFYNDLIDWFLEQKLNLRFRCITVDRTKVDLMTYHENDQELGFYKFYYQMLQHWILDWNKYNVYCDFKSNRITNRLHVLHRCLSHANISSEISSVQATRSRESVLIQLSDVLTGISAARINNAQLGQTKERLITSLEHKLGWNLAPTSKTEQKLNIF